MFFRALKTQSTLSMHAPKGKYVINFFNRSSKYLVQVNHEAKDTSALNYNDAKYHMKTSIIFISYNLAKYCLIIHFYKEFYQRNICKPETQSLFLDKLYLLTRQNRLRNSTHTCIICVLFHAHVLEQKAHLTKSCFGCRGTNWLPVLYTYGMVVSNICLIYLNDTVYWYDQKAVYC